MGYMDSYKRLANLCRDCGYTAGVSDYIEAMENKPSGAYRVPGWQDDYKKLKHYRWVRNQIAHENNASEENLCSPEDTKWIENFYRRIMNETDPLAVYNQKRPAQVQKRYAQVQKRPAQVQKRYAQVQQHKPVNKKPKRNSRRTGLKLLGWVAYVLFIAAIVLLIAYFLKP